MKPRTQSIFDKLIEKNPDLIKCSKGILDAYELLLKTSRRGGLIFVCGNGGSAVDAEHIAGELMKGFNLNRPIPEDEKDFLSKYFLFRRPIAFPKITGGDPCGFSGIIHIDYHSGLQ